MELKSGVKYVTVMYCNTEIFLSIALCIKDLLSDMINVSVHFHEYKGYKNKLIKITRTSSTKSCNKSENRKQLKIDGFFIDLFPKATQIFPLGSRAKLKGMFRFSFLNNIWEVYICLDLKRSLADYHFKLFSIFAFQNLNEFN